MMPAEQWYEYQDNYRRHGIDLKPQVESKPQAKVKKPSITMLDKIKIITLLFVIGAVCIGVVISSAYVASVRHEINTTIRYSAALQGEIENLNVRIETATNIRVIEEKAKEQLGMVYPTPDQFVFLESRDRPQGDFATRLRIQAFN